MYRRVSSDGAKHGVHGIFVVDGKCVQFLLQTHVTWGVKFTF